MTTTVDRDHAAAGVVTIRSASTPFEARIFAAVLEGAGIPCYVDSGLLNDEFAMSQQLMNQLGVRVRVPAALRQEAEEVLTAAAPDDEELAAEAMAATPEESTADADAPGEFASQRAVLILVLLSSPIWLFVLYYLLFVPAA